MQQIPSIERQCQENLIKAAQKWCVVTGQPITKASQLAFDDARLLPAVIEKYMLGERQPGDKQSSMTLRVYTNAMNWFSDGRNWPGGNVRLPKLKSIVMPKRIDAKRNGEQPDISELPAKEQRAVRLLARLEKE